MDKCECLNCGWAGTSGELVCTDEDFNDSTKSSGEIEFNLCPECESKEIEETEETEED